MQCQPVGDLWRANPPKAWTHGGNYDIGGGGGGRYIGRRLPMGVEERRVESSSGERDTGQEPAAAVEMG
jgi:hypothetical protein